MLLQFFLGSLLIAMTVVIHAVALDRLIHFLDVVGPVFFKYLHKYWKLCILIVTVMGVFMVHIIQVWLWALFYMVVGALPDFEEALYFSTTSFTTVGYGDIYLDKTWRLISAFQSANGFLLFGWSTAFIFEVMNKIYKDERIDKIKSWKK